MFVFLSVSAYFLPLLQASNMQIMPHKCKSIPISEETSSGEEESAQLRHNPPKSFHSETQGRRLFEGYLGELLNKALRVCL